MPADVDRVWDMCDVCGDLLAYCPEWGRRYPEVVEHQARNRTAASWRRHCRLAASPDDLR
jgi:hypothetical protein